MAPLQSGLRSGLRKVPVEWDGGGGGDPGFTGTLPTTIGELSGWTGTACWTVGFNFQDATGASVACASMSDGAAMTVSKLTNNPTILTAPQAGWASQGGISIAAANELLFVTDADWDVNATVPTIYMATVSMASGPSSVQEIATGLTGTGSQGWMVEALGASGLRITCMGSASSYVTGSTAMFDGNPHVIAWVIDDAAGKAKLFTEWGTVELTGLSYTQTGSLICTVGPSSTGAHWSATTSYFQMARGQNAQAYTKAASVVTTYNTALTTGVAPAPITGLPTTLAELNGVLGTVSMTHGWNLSSLTPAPITGASGPSLAAYTGAMSGSANGTAPTLSAAPQIKPSFTSQACITCDSTHDNLYGVGAMPKVEHTAIMVWRSPDTAYTGSYTGTILGVPPTSGVGFQQPWRYRATATGTLALNVYDSFSAIERSATLSVAGINTDQTWRVAAHTRGASGSPNRVSPGGITPAASANSTEARDAALAPADGGFFRLKDDYQNTRPLEGARIAFFAWTATVASNADTDTAVANFCWRYGL